MVARLYASIGSVGANGPESPHSEEQVHDPTAAGVRTTPAAVVEDACVLASSVLQGVAQDRHLVPSAFVVDGPGQMANRTVIPHEPERVYPFRFVVQFTGDVVELANLIVSQAMERQYSLIEGQHFLIDK